MNLQDILKLDFHITILTGAGISAESGIQTFRDDNGLWEGHRLEDVATPEAFEHNPELVHEFYNMRRRALLDQKIQPSPAHIALAKLQDEWPAHNGGQVTIITQNIDNLHERGGAQDVIHMHGELLKIFCTHCAFKNGKSNETAPKHEILTDTSPQTPCPLCEKTGTLRPDIVWFGEFPYARNTCDQSVQNSDLFISIGTSGNVYPAAGFVSEAIYAGAQTLEINLEPSLNAQNFHHGFYGPASQEVPKAVDLLLKG